MKMRTLLLLSVILAGCSGTRVSINQPEFDWMPNDLLWQQNIRDCRSQPTCNAADLFQRT